MILGGHHAASSESTPSAHDPNYKIRVQLTLLNVLNDVNADDRQASKLVRLLQYNQVLSAPITAEAFLTDGPSTPDEVRSIQQEILRFLQTKDKYAALASMLLKSKTFYGIHEQQKQVDGTDIMKISRSAVSLPRTQHKKPYIPVSLTIGNSKRNEEDVYPISISHQHPFVGIAQLLETDIDEHSETPLLVGMDIVVFEEYNDRLYSSEDEFLEVFQDYFTNREFALIQGQKQQSFRLQEFYIRWSMKEAYAKALGVGMGVDFSSFDLLLSSDTEASCTGVFASMSELQGDSNNIYSQIGFMEDLKGMAPRKCWEFAFLPLLETGEGEESSNAAAKGCACVCIGPFGSAPPQLRMELLIQWTELNSLIEWHQSLP